LIRSMTGFGLGEIQADGFSVRVELRTVNHRFLQARFRLPSEFSSLEPQVDKLVKKSLARGAVTLTVIVDRSQEQTAVKVDEQAAARYAHLIGDLAKNLGIKNDMSLSSLVGLPGVISTQSGESDHDTEAKCLLEAVQQALTNLVEMRSVEGAHLEADIRSQADAVGNLRVTVGERMPIVVQQHFDNMRQRAEDLMGREATIDPKDLSRELAMLAEKSDVAEEVSRLDSHLEQLDKVLLSGGEVGRKLDFLVQELYREANTIGSKVGDAEVAHAVVELKTHIERIREQVQNVE
jgi:uncharacterized protein (TIGR00255 family)